MIISDLTYLEATSEAGNVVGGTSKKDEHKPKKYGYYKNTTQIAVGNVAVVNLKNIKNSSVEISIDQDSKIEQSA
jgi:hypothetical protein